MSLERLTPTDSPVLKRGLERNVKTPEQLRPVRTLLQLEQMCEGDARLTKLFDAMESFLYRYVETVIRYDQILKKGLADKEQTDALAELEPIRTRIHNGMMDSVNIFSRNLAAAGHDNSWIAEMVGSRAKYAAFAMRAVYENEMRLREPDVPAVVAA